MRSVFSAAVTATLPVATALTGEADASSVWPPDTIVHVADSIAVELIEDRQLIPLDAAQWNALVAGNETNSVFQTYEWFDAWWHTFGAAHRLFFLVLRREGNIIGFAPLMLRSVSWRGQRLEFVGTGNADYQDFIVPHEKEAALLAIGRFLCKHSSRWRSAWLNNLPTQSSTMGHLRRLRTPLGVYVVEESRLRCPSLSLEDPRDAEKLLKKYSLKRPLNWFTSRGEVKFRNLGSLPEIQSLLPQFFEQHVSRWHAVGRPSLFEGKSQRAFYLALAIALHSAGWLLFSVVEFNGQPIAFHFGFDYFGSILWYKPSFDQTYAEHSPGLLLTRKMIEDGLQRSKRELDFTIGEEAFKDRFANVSRYNVTLSLYHSLPYALCAQGWRRLRRSLGQVRRKIAAARIGTPAASEKGAVGSNDSSQ